MMPPKQMTANPLKPKRYRPGKVLAEEYSEEEEEDPEDFDEVDEADIQELSEIAIPKYSLFPATKIASNLKEVDLKERRRKAAAEEARRIAAEKAARAKAEEGFVTEESEGEEESGAEEESSDSESGSEESSSEEEAPKVHLRPTFIKKDLRNDIAPAPLAKNEDEIWAEEERRRKEKADALIQEQLERNAAARAAGKKNWDDDEDSEGDQVDDTDGLDPENEYAAWKLRELKRVKREREVIEVAEKEREEIERRRNLSQADREAEDREFLEKQKEEREGKGKMGYMQKYFHKGAFFQDDAKEQGLDRRDIMGSRYADDVTNRELLPQYMQIRDMTRLGRKGRTKYKDLKTEDTGRWGDADVGRGPRKGPDGTVDERFMPDRDGGKSGASGSNKIKVNERRKPPPEEGPPLDAPRGPREDERHTIPDRGKRDEIQNRSRYDQRDHPYAEDDDARWRQRIRSRRRGEPDKHRSDYNNEQQDRYTGNDSTRRRSPRTREDEPDKHRSDHDQAPNNGDRLSNNHRSPTPPRRRRSPLPLGPRHQHLHHHHHRSYSRSRSPSPSQHRRRRIQNSEQAPRRKRSPSPYYRDRDRDRDRYDRGDKRRRVQVT